MSMIMSKCVYVLILFIIYYKLYLISLSDLILLALVNISAL